jgi:hypothetical protein
MATSSELQGAEFNGIRTLCEDGGLRVEGVCMGRSANRYYASCLTATIDADRCAFFPVDIGPWLEEARATPVFRNVVDALSSADPTVKVALSQSTSLDDCLTMYALVRHCQPRVMVETGVFYGAVSAMILSAMEKNGVGELHSLDLPIPSDGLPADMRGGLVSADLRHRWHLILADSRVALPPLLDRLDTIDGFHHDSLHTTPHMTWEYEVAWPHIRPGGFLSSHDVLMTPSWHRFSKRHAREVAELGRVYGVGIALKRCQDPFTCL